ncbi:MAG TPA: hypothetical protein VF144_03390 [Chitinophagaceae bacterium]
MNLNKLFDLSPYALLTIIVIFVCAVGYLGYFLRKRWRRRHADDKIHSRVSGAAIGVLSLLMAFTFSVAITKFETQRRIIAQEAAYINTAILRCDLYPDSIRNLLRAEFKNYIEARIEYYNELDNDVAAQKLKMASLVSNKIWASVASLSENSEYAMRSAQMIPAITNVIDISITRDGEKISKVPVLVLWVLVIFMLIDGFILGLEIFDKNKPFAVMYANALVMALTLNLIIELHQPRTGLINLDAVEQKIVDLRELFK